MGSPYEYAITSRVHTVTTDRGAAMILNKILTSVAGFEAEGQRDLCFTTVAQLRADPFREERYSDGPQVSLAFSTLAELNNTWRILEGFFDAYLLSVDKNARIVLSLSAGYAWRGFEKYECVVVFDMGLKSLRKEG